MEPLDGHIARFARAHNLLGFWAVAQVAKGNLAFGQAPAQVCPQILAGVLEEGSFQRADGDAVELQRAAPEFHLRFGVL